MSTIVAPDVLGRFLIAWQALHGVNHVRAKEVLTGIAYPHKGSRQNELRESMRAFVGIPATADNQWQPCTVQRLGFALRAHIGIEANGLAVYARFSTRRKMQTWIVCTPAAALVWSGGQPIAPKPIPKKRTPKPPKLPTPPAVKPPKPAIQPCVLMSPPGNVHLKPVLLLRETLGRGFPVRFESRFHLQLPVRANLTATERAVADLRARFPGIAVEITTTRGVTSAFADQPLNQLQPTGHRWPPLDTPSRPRPRPFFWDPFAV